MLHTNCHLEWSEERRKWWIQIISDYKLQPLSQLQIDSYQILCSSRKCSYSSHGRFLNWTHSITLRKFSIILSLKYFGLRKSTLFKISIGLPQVADVIENRVYTETAAHSDIPLLLINIQPLRFLSVSQLLHCVHCAHFPVQLRQFSPLFPFL